MALTLPVSLEAPEDRPLVLAAEVIQAGGIVVYPTETLYGLGANALHVDAIQRVRAIKRRDGQKPILVIVPDLESVEPLVGDLHPAARKFMDAFWPGPLTLVMKASAAVPRELTQGAPTIGIRVPSSSLCLKLLRLCGCPITSTSANISGQLPFHAIPEIRNALAPGVDLYLDAGRLPDSAPSTVIDVSVSPPRLLRPGAVSTERLLAVAPELKVSSSVL
jgi:L-threonylcarbamoyladenylate synthase